MAFVYASFPPEPAYSFVNELLPTSNNEIPTLGCIIPCPSITKSFLSFKTGLFKICAILPISSNPVFKVNFVSESNVITYFIFGILFKFLASSIVFAKKLSSSFSKIYSLN